ncbi:tRNA pseudouridine55 synthase [Geomicrobium halophilum]|uniref:tRNA pseudouridine synthase B n=1 Tax=Geomicrobium halophilum TaxID=549000 RepID=A0A841PYJ7_9BACL|nr:tRNA pseudouridine(55) synthase TruB [Geomicrobium halophilum]MBB6449265.1 tRNA pseudouridine55 synthase [Geomicrobium halophilum]
MDGGILPLNKPAGVTSHDCVLMARRWLKTSEVGHTGTLDPEVTGVLPLCVGRATKLVPILMDESKAYEGTIALGSATTTEDASGEVVDRKRVQTQIAEANIDEALQALTGELKQVPPMYSAVKVNGKRLYEYARLGESVERPSRCVSIYSLHRTGAPFWSEDEQHLMIPFSVACSKGTYVRTLAVETGNKLGYPAHLFTLLRTRSAGVELNQCYSVEEMDRLASEERAFESLLSVDHVLRHFQHYEVNERQATKITNGAVLRAREYPEANRLVFTHNQQPIAIYVPHPRKHGMIKPDVMLAVPANNET